MRWILFVIILKLVSIEQMLDKLSVLTIFPLLSILIVHLHLLFSILFKIHPWFVLVIFSSCLVYVFDVEIVLNGLNDVGACFLDEVLQILGALWFLSCPHFEAHDDLIELHKKLCNQLNLHEIGIMRDLLIDLVNRLHIKNVLRSCDYLEEIVADLLISIVIPCHIEVLPYHMVFHLLYLPLNQFETSVHIIQ